MRRRPPHAADAWEATHLPRCVSYTAILRLGPFDKHRAECASVEDAHAAAAELEERFSRFGRRALVYGITPEGYSIHIKRAS